MSSSICCLAARRCSCSTLVPCSLFSQASFCSLLYHNSSCYLSLDRQGRFLPDTLIITMGNAGVNTPATSLATTGPGVSFVELWDGASQIVWHHECGSHPGPAAQAV